jgi:hypothetical protein
MSALWPLVLEVIRQVSGFAHLNEEEFVKRVRDARKLRSFFFLILPLSYVSTVISLPYVAKPICKQVGSICDVEVEITSLLE